MSADLTRRRILGLSTAIIGSSFAGCANQGEFGTEDTAATPSGKIVSEFVSSRNVEYRTGSLVTISELRYYNPETDELDTLSPRRDIFLRCLIEIENLGSEGVAYPSASEFHYWTQEETFPLSEELPNGVSWEDLRPEGPDLRQPGIAKDLPRDALLPQQPERINLFYDVPDRTSAHYIRWSAEADPERSEPVYFEFQV